MTDPDHGSREHAEFSPSASDRWLACPASIRLSRGLPDEPDTEYSIAGTLCHEKGEQYLLNHYKPETDNSAVAKPYLDAAGVERMVILPAEKWRPHVENYVYTVRECVELGEMLCEENTRPQLIVEKAVDIEGQACYGTPDAVVLWFDDRGAPVIHVFDLKAGKHVVWADAPQFRTYLLGLIKKHCKGLSKELLNKGQYVAHVCQVANEEEPHNSHPYTYAELMEHRKLVRKAIKDAETAEPGPVGDHCTFCPAKREGVCPAQRQRAISVLDDLEEPKLPEPAGLSVAEKLGILEHADAISKWFDEIRESVTAAILNGSSDYPDWKVIEGRANRKWNPEKSEEDIAEELEMYGIEPWERKLTSFTVAEKALKKSGANIDHLVVKPVGKPKLVPSSAKGEPLKKRLEALDGD